MPQANNSASCYRTPTCHWLFSQNSMTQSVGFPNVKPRCSDVIIEPTWLSVVMRFCSVVSDSAWMNLTLFLLLFDWNRAEKDWHGKKYTFLFCTGCNGKMCWCVVHFFHHSRPCDAVLSKSRVLGSAEKKQATEQIEKTKQSKFNKLFEKRGRSLWNIRCWLVIGCSARQSEIQQKKNWPKLYVIILFILYKMIKTIIRASLCCYFIACVTNPT